MIDVWAKYRWNTKEAVILVGHLWSESGNDEWMYVDKMEKDKAGTGSSVSQGKWKSGIFG